MLMVQYFVTDIFQFSLIVNLQVLDIKGILFLTVTMFYLFYHMNKMAQKQIRCLIYNMPLFNKTSHTLWTASKGQLSSVP